MNSSTKSFAASNAISWKALSQKGFSAGFFHSIKEFKDLWDQSAPKDNIFLQATYLEILENNPPDGMSFCYLLFRKDKEIVGVAIGQIQYFNIEQSLNIKENEASPCFFNTIGRYLKGLVASKAEFTTLICGNLLLTGEHGYYFKSNTVSAKLAFDLVNEGMNQAREELDGTEKKVAGFLIKDFFETSRNEGDFQKTPCNEFTIQPNMILGIPASWKTFEDYTGAMSSKYRVRTKRAFKKFGDLEKRSFDEAMIVEYSQRIFDLYQMVAENSGFNLINLNPNYLPALKRAFKDDFTLDGYFLDGELVAFYTTIVNGHETEAHFLGMQPDCNRQYQVYMNILYDIIRKGIDRQSKYIVFARTATEIKSSVGAVPHQMYCYMRHPNNFANKFMTPILDYLKPEEDAVLRNPFKDPPVAHRAEA